jgi:hypothetical protein
MNNGAFLCMALVVAALCVAQDSTQPGRNLDSPVKGTSKAATATPTKISQRAVRLRKSYMLLLLVMATATSAVDDREPALLLSLSRESCMLLGNWWDDGTAASLPSSELLTSFSILLSLAVGEQRMWPSMLLL